MHFSWQRLLLCPFGRHKRSRSKASYVGGDMASVCRHCGVPMHKRSMGHWKVDRPAKRRD